MTTKQQELLAIDVRLLLARHGRAASLRALALALNRTEEELEADMQAFLRSAPAKKKAIKVFSVMDLKASDPNLIKQLVLLEARYDNRTFLSELRDVKRFLDRHGNRSPKLKSREVGKKRVFELLASLDILELKQLASAKEGDVGFSSLGLISDQILNRNRGD